MSLPTERRPLLSIVNLMALGMEVSDALAVPRYNCDFLGLEGDVDDVDDVVLGDDRDRCLRPDWCWPLRVVRWRPSSTFNSSMTSIRWWTSSTSTLLDAVVFCNKSLTLASLEGPEPIFRDTRR